MTEKNLQISGFDLTETNTIPLSEEQMNFIADHLKLQFSYLRGTGNTIYIFC
jgi:hypothetical protein